jgi:hypothetical protein
MRFDRGKGKKGQVGEGEELGVFLFWYRNTHADGGGRSLRHPLVISACGELQQGPRSVSTYDSSTLYIQSLSGSGVGMTFTRGHVEARIRNTEAKGDSPPERDPHSRLIQAPAYR